ncbi:hypothetical protein Tco_1004910 [Tanacetum coccineum]|uniref:Reverse transcriptase domain-containing protein n=1 Tax=Tanacetum coccineum TaxID=301880 RepID=A0ABQ5FF44_9ASTR
MVLVLAVKAGKGLYKLGCRQREVEDRIKEFWDENAEDVQMADHLRPMEELLRIPILGIEDAIIVPAVLADQFELKPESLDFIRGYSAENTRPTLLAELKQEPETITEVVEIPSSQSTPLVPPPETLPLSAPKPKEDPKPNPYQPPIPYPCRLQEENFQALKNPTGRADHFDEPSEADKSEIYTLIGEPPDTFLMEDEEIKLNPLKDSDDLRFQSKGIRDTPGFS